MSSVINPHAGLGFPKPRGRTKPSLLAAAMLVIAGALIVALHQVQWEFPVMHAINGLARRSMMLDRTMHALTARDLLQGIPFMALIWFLWFDSEGAATRIQLFLGVIAASCAGILSRLLQLSLPTHLRPLHQPMLGFVPPAGVDPDALNHFNSFPSDHGAVFFALAAVVWRVRPNLGAAAFIWAAIVDLARVYEGYHFPSDVIGSIGVGLAVLAAFQAARDRPWIARIVAFEQTHRSLFYMLAFLTTVQIATLFDDLREIGRGAAAVLLHHDIFNGS